jgi:hypothetical protein
MNKGNDIVEFTTLLDSVSLMMSRGKYAPNEAVTVMFFNALEAFPMDAVRAAFSQYASRGTFPPVPNDILTLLETSDGRPGPEEAFAQVQPAFNEDDSVVWTEEMAHAWGQCRALDNEVSRRMVFKETYTAAVAKARADRKPVVWSLAEGNDHGRRVEAVKRAQMAGIPLAHHRADELLTLAPPTAQVALLTTNVPTGPSDAEIAGRARLRELMERMRKPAEEAPSEDAQAKEAARIAGSNLDARLHHYAQHHNVPMVTPAEAKRRVLGPVNSEMQA